MSSEYELHFLHRIAAMPGPDDIPYLSEHLSLGSPDEVVRRLLSLPGMSRTPRPASRTPFPSDGEFLRFEREGRTVLVFLALNDKGETRGVGLEEACREDVLEVASVFDSGEGILTAESEEDWWPITELQPQAPHSVPAQVHVTRPPPELTPSALAVEWKATVEKRLPPLGLHPMAEGLVVQADGRLLMLDTATGQTRWAIRPARQQSFITATSTLLLVGGDESTVYALDPRTGKERWTVKVQGHLSHAPCELGDGHVALTTSSGQLTLVSAEGRVRWRAQLGPIPLNPPFLVGDLLLVVDNVGQFSLLYASTGKVLRRLSVFELLPQSGTQRAPSFAFRFRNVAGRIFLVSATQSVELHLPELKTGLHIHKPHPVSLREVSGRPILFESEWPTRPSSDGTVSIRHRLSAISLPDLTELWEGSSLGAPLGVPVEVRGRWALLSTPSLSQGPLCLQLVNPQNGRALHSLVLGEVGGAGASLAARGEQVFVSVRGDVWCVRVRA